MKLCKLKNDPSKCVWEAYSNRGDGKLLLRLVGYSHVVKAAAKEDLVNLS